MPYDAIGRRIQKIVNDLNSPNDPSKSFVRRYVYDGNDILLEYDGSNHLLARYTHSGLATDDVLSVNITNIGVDSAVAKNAKTYTYLKDSIGSITDISDVQGNKIQHYNYSAYGTLLSIQNAEGADITASPNLATAYTFAGRELDSESGLYYNRARYYDSAIGRFIQRDPDPGSLGAPMSVVNGYVYAANNPVNITDPSGESWLGDTLSNFYNDIGGLVGLAASAFSPLIGINLLLAEIGSRNPTLGSIMLAVAVGAACYFSGGAAGPAVASLVGMSGSTAAAVVGGAIVGGMLGGTLNVVLGTGTFMAGFIQGAIAGGMGAYSAASAANSASASAETPSGPTDGQVAVKESQMATESKATETVTKTAQTAAEDAGTVAKTPAQIVRTVKQNIIGRAGRCASAAEAFCTNSGLPPEFLGSCRSIRLGMCLGGRWLP
jgi:RHS repeat-associated protein